MNEQAGRTALVIEIASSNYTIQMNPDRGGRVEKFTYAKGSESVDIFKPKPDINSEQDGIPLFGSFAMVPFCNRLFPAVLLTNEGPVIVPANWTEQTCAIHGLGLSEPWKPNTAASHACQFSTELKSLDGRCIGVGMQEFEVSDERGFETRVGFFNDQFEWILAGSGFHPWFNLAVGEAQLEFVAEGRFHTDARCMPTSYSELASTEVSLNSRTDDGIDACFGEWSGKARLALDAHAVPLEISSSAPNLHVYINKDLRTICVEPVGHVTNATHDRRWERFAGMTKVHYGETIWLDMRVSLQHSSG